MSGKDTFETGGLYFAAYLKAARIPWKGCLPDNRDGRRGRMKFVFENSEEIPQLQWTAGYGMNSTSNRRIAARLYNSTDAVELDIKSVRPSVTTVTESAGGFAQVTFTGSAKTFLVQFRALDGTSVAIENARLEFWRVA